MEEIGKNKETGKLITADFKSEQGIRSNKTAHISSNQSNPILNRLFKLTHSELAKNKDNYKSFSKFKPEDLI